VIGRANPLTSTSSPSLDSGTHAAATGDASDREPFGQQLLGRRVVVRQPETKVRYLIRGLRSPRFKAGDLLQWDTSRGDLTGLM
jgi:hypothetical protein